MLRHVRRFLAGLGLLLLLFGLAVLGVIVWQNTRDPLAALPVASQPAVEIGRTDSQENGRVVSHVTLEAPPLGSIGFTMSLPEPLPQRRLPVVILLGGLGKGRQHIRHIAQPGPNALIGYDWPVERLPPGGLEALVLATPHLYREIMTAPGEIAALTAWLAQRPWADPERISLLGFSLGAFALPAAQRLVQQQGGRVAASIIAYGGAPIGDVIADHPILPKDWPKELIRFVGNLAFRPVDPLIHLPYLEGRFLVLGGKEDALIPAAAASRLQAAVPEPKTVLLFEGEHINMGDRRQAAELRDRIIAAGEAFLLEHGAVRRPEASVPN